MITPEEIELGKVVLPNFGLPKSQPQLTRKHYSARIVALRKRMSQEGYSHFLVFADREHFANMHFLSGYDPRFEDALLIVEKSGMPTILVGNEGMGYLGDTPADLDPALYQEFSLVGQPRSESFPLPEIFKQCGIKKGSRVACAGWKYFASESLVEIPAFIVDILRKLVGASGKVINGGAMLMSPESGLRSMNDADQIAVFEFAATHCTQSLRNMLENIKPGMSELEGVQLMKLNGLPLSCHPMLTAGERACMGLPSPSTRVIKKGDTFTSALGYWGSLSARAGWFVESERELPSSARNFLKDVVKPYFALVVNYYEQLSIGASCGDIFAMTTKFLADKKIKLALNPGHLVHLDEWVSTPFYKGSKTKIKSGMMIQVDLIPVAKDKKLFGTNIEDGVAIADSKLRKEIAAKYPEVWKRMQQRRKFMVETLGILLPEEVLPLSNLAARLSPFILSPNLAMKVV